jgi:putative hemolysin
MEPDSWAGVVALLPLLILLWVTSAALSAWPRLNRARLRHLASESATPARFLMRLFEDPVSPRSTFAVVNVLCVALTASILAVLEVRELAGTPALMYTAAIASVIVILWIQLVGHAVGSVRPEPTVFALIGVLRVAHFCFKPIAVALEGAIRFVVPEGFQQSLEGNSQADEDLRMIVDAVEEGGALEDGEREMIHSIFEMGDRTAREIMVPRVDVVAVEAEEPLRLVLQSINLRGHSRIPIYQDTIDNIVGVVYAKDLLRHMEEGSLDDPSRSLGRPPHFIPEGKKTDELLREMQRDKVHMAIVLDEYGGTSGIVTIEDLLEEIVGEIQDEYDMEEKTVEKLSDTEAVFDARVRIHDVKDVLDVSLEDREYDTVGGLVYDSLGKIPVVGDEFKVDGLWLTVLSTSGKRIKKVKIRVEPDATREQSYSG